MPNCIYCHSDNVALLGSLGASKHYRCKDCGGSFHRSKPQPASTIEQQLASARRLLAATPSNHPHRQALERKVQQLSGHGGAPSTMADWRRDNPNPTHGCGHMQGRGAA